MPCQKRKYATRAAAQRSAERFLRKYGDETRPFLCLDCSAFHLTHLPLWQVINSDAARRMVAEQQGREIAQDEEQYLRQRLAEIAYEIGRPARELAEARHACAQAVATLRKAYANDLRWQRQVRKMLGMPE